MKKQLILTILTLLTMQSCTDELPEPEKRQQGKEVYDRRELPKVRRVGGN